MPRVPRFVSCKQIPGGSSGRDFCSERGARVIARTIREAWAKVGVTAIVVVHPASPTSLHYVTRLITPVGGMPV